MKKITKTLCLFLPCFIATSAIAERQQYRLTHHPDAVVVDGFMDESVWQNTTKMDLLYENNPGEGIAPPVKTEIFFYENGSALNVFIKAYDPEPEKIRASLRDRDALWRDDNAGIIVDTFNDERSGYEFFVNPLGAQADIKMDDTNGWNTDGSWDAIWDSAGQITDFGYVVEMSIPFNALRFPHTTGPKTFNIAGWRNYPRGVKHQIATYKSDRNIKCNLCQFDQLIGFETAKAGNNFQVTPTLTVSRSDEKPEVPGDWENGSVETDPGLDVRWGITQDVVLNATINPDFSQVEADAGQLDVNNTFSLFFPEKRPFFLDGASYFDTNRFNLVHTRNIAEPDYGLKVTGKTNDHSYGLMVANDKHTTFLIPGVIGSDIATLDEGSEVAVARYQADVGERNNIGVLMTNRSADDYRNTLLSVDGTYWLSQADSVRYQLVRSDTNNPDEIQEDFDLDKEQAGNALSVAYSHKTRDYSLRASYNNVGEDFRADLGFFTKVDYERVVLGGERNWYGTKDDFLSEWGFWGDWDKTYDQAGKLIEEEYEIHGFFDGPMQSYMNYGVVSRERFFDDEYFDELQFRSYGTITPYPSLKVENFIRVGDQVDFANTRLGDVIIWEPEITWDANEHFKANLSYRFNELEVDEGRVFTANQMDLRLTYQFDMRSILKLVVQYTDIDRNVDVYEYDDIDDKPNSRDRFFSTQLIYSYKINPQTLFFVGYSDAGFQDDELGSLERNQRTIFTKFSYAWQM